MATTDPITVDTKSLREKALAATPGVWHPEEVEFEGEEGRFYRVSDANQVSVVAFSDVQQTEDMEFIAAANPQKVLALLDRIAELEKQIVLDGWVADGLEAGFTVFERAYEALKAQYYYQHVRAKETEGRYNELLFTVSAKYPDETRHETAKRRLQTADQPSGHQAAMVVSND